MHYHPLIGIAVFLVAIIFSFILGRLFFKKKLNLSNKRKIKEPIPLPKGEITSPDAPWLDK